MHRPEAQCITTFYESYSCVGRPEAKLLGTLLWFGWLVGGEM